MSRKTVARFEILGESHPIYDGMNIIGRDIEASVIIKDLKISKKHAVISVIEDKHYITDLKSSNGCSYQDETLVPFKFYLIQDRSSIILGDIVGTYYIDSSSSEDIKFLKPKLPKHINFAPTQQIIEIPRINITEDDTHFAPTQLLDHTSNLKRSEQSSSSTKDSANKVFSLIEKNNKTNDSKEIVLCDDSLNDNLDESFAKVTLDDSIVVPSTQECFSKPNEDSYNDSTVIPCTQDVSFEAISHHISKLMKEKKNSQDSNSNTQINEDDSDATDTEIAHDDIVDDNICISIKKLTPEPSEIKNITLENKTILSDDEEIDFCEISASTNENILNQSIEANVTKTSSCLNDFNQNINDSDLQNSSIKSKTDVESIPETEEYDINVAHNKIVDHSDVIPSTQNDNIVNIKEKCLTKSSESSVVVDFMAPTQLLSNESSRYSSNNFRDPAGLIVTTIRPLEVDTSDNHDTYLAPTQILDTSAFEHNLKNTNIKMSTPTKRYINSNKSNNMSKNESLNEEDDINFLASTQEMLNNTKNTESQSHYLDYYSSQEIDGIPEITSYHDDIDRNIFVTSTQILDNVVNQGDVDFSAKTQLLDKYIDKNVATRNRHDVDFSATTQILDYLPKNSISTRNVNNLHTKKNKFTSNQQDVVVNYLTPTQKFSKKNFDDGDNVYFLAPTQTLMSNQNELRKTVDNDIFLVPTQELAHCVKEITNKGKFTTTDNITITSPRIQHLTNAMCSSTLNSQFAKCIDDDIFMAPTQELIDKNICRIEQIRENDDIIDSDDSDIVIKKKSPRVIKETQEIVDDSDSDIEVRYKRKKPPRIVETQEMTQHKSCDNDSAIISDLGETEESIRLFVSNGSINVSPKSLNMSNRKDESQLEINLPTEKEYFVSQNIRPKNPLLQVLSTEDTQMESSQNDPIIGSTAALNTFTKLLNDNLEPTQINIDELVNESMVCTQDSNPEDYDEYCDMETQPIDDIFNDVKCVTNKKNDNIFNKSTITRAGSSKESVKKNVDLVDKEVESIRGKRKLKRTSSTSENTSIEENIILTKNKQKYRSKNKDNIMKSTTDINKKTLKKCNEDKTTSNNNESTETISSSRRKKPKEVEEIFTLEEGSSLNKKKQAVSSLDTSVQEENFTIPKNIRLSKSKQVTKKRNKKISKRSTYDNIAAFLQGESIETEKETPTIENNEDNISAKRLTNEDLLEDSSVNKRAFLQGNKKGMEEKEKPTIEEKNISTKKVTNDEENVPKESTSDNMGDSFQGKRRRKEGKENPPSTKKGTNKDEDVPKESTSLQGKKKENEEKENFDVEMKDISTKRVTRGDTKTYENIIKESASDNKGASLQGKKKGNDEKENPTIDENAGKINESVPKDSTFDNIEAFLQGKIKETKKENQTTKDNDITTTRNVPKDSSSDNKGGIASLQGIKKRKEEKDSCRIEENAISTKIVTNEGSTMKTENISKESFSLQGKKKGKEDKDSRSNEENENTISAKRVTCETTKTNENVPTESSSNNKRLSRQEKKKGKEDKDNHSNEKNENTVSTNRVPRETIKTNENVPIESSSDNKRVSRQEKKKGKEDKDNPSNEKNENTISTNRVPRETNKTSENVSSESSSDYKRASLQEKKKGKEDIDNHSIEGNENTISTKRVIRKPTNISENVPRESSSDNKRASLQEIKKGKEENESRIIEENENTISTKRVPRETIKTNENVSSESSYDYKRASLQGKKKGKEDKDNHSSEGNVNTILAKRLTRETIKTNENVSSELFSDYKQHSLQEKKKGKEDKDNHSTEGYENTISTKRGTRKTTKTNENVPKDSSSDNKQATLKEQKIRKEEKENPTIEENAVSEKTHENEPKDLSSNNKVAFLHGKKKGKEEIENSTIEKSATSTKRVKTRSDESTFDNIAAFLQGNTKEDSTFEDDDISTKRVTRKATKINENVLKDTSSDNTGALHEGRKKEKKDIKENASSIKKIEDNKTNEKVSKESTSNNMGTLLQGKRRRKEEKENPTIEENTTSTKKVTKESTSLQEKKKGNEEKKDSKTDKSDENVQGQRKGKEEIEENTTSTKTKRITKSDKTTENNDNITTSLRGKRIITEKENLSIEENDNSTKTRRATTSKIVKHIENSNKESNSNNIVGSPRKRKVVEKEENIIPTKTKRITNVDKREDPTSDDSKTPSKKVIEIWRSTRASSVSVEGTTKRNTRGKSVSSETDVNLEGKKTKRKTLTTVREHHKKKTTDNEDIVMSLTHVEGEYKNKKSTKNIENEKQKTITRKKILSDSFSLEESPTKKLKINSQDNLIEFNPSSASTSSPRREARLRHKVVFTMLDDTNLEATICRLGGTIVNSSQECTVLVTSKISRSLKFLVAVSLGKPIVGPEWVKACGNAHKFVDPWNYILNDKETESIYNFRLRDAIIQGQTTKLFEGYTCLLLVSKNLDVLKNVIEASGGNCITRVPKNGNFIVVSYPEDKNKYAKFLKQKPPVKCVAAEAIFAGALKQKLMLDEHILK